ncbi:MAG: hypothetical protein ACOX4H_04400 [Bacillota bacterium]|jgi:hypothetical protein
MVFSTKSNQCQMKEKIDIREAFTLWDLLKSKYTLIDFLNTLKNRAHDADLKILLGVIVKEFQIFALKVENYQKKVSILTPDKYRKSVNLYQNPESVTDEYIANELFICIQEELERVARGFRTSTTNDDIRRFLETLLKKRLKFWTRLFPILRQGDGLKRRRFIQKPYPMLRKRSPLLKYLIFGTI